MGYILPEIEGKIKKITIFPPIEPIKIIDIHRIMMYDKIVPATIMRAKTTEMELLRDISVTLASMYISNENKQEYIADYFKISYQEVEKIIYTTITKKHQNLLDFQEKLKVRLAIYIPWDIESNCLLRQERVDEFLKDIGLSFYLKYKNFSPCVIPN